LVTKNGFHGNHSQILLSKLLKDRKSIPIRYDVNNRWVAGRIIQHAYGVRTKQYDHFANGECKSTQRIRIFPSVGANINYSYTGMFTDKFSGIEYESQFQVEVDSRVLNFMEIDKLAANDGFDSTHDFFKWFFNGFEGKIIHFTDLKY